MQASAGLIAGFAAGIAIAVGAMVWLRVQEDVTRDREAARVAELESHVRLLEQKVARLSDEISSNRQMFRARQATFAVVEDEKKLEESSSVPQR